MPQYETPVPSDEGIERAKQFLDADTEKDEWQSPRRRLLGDFSNYEQCFIHAFALGYDAGEEEGRDAELLAHADEGSL